MQQENDDRDKHVDDARAMCDEFDGYLDDARALREEARQQLEMVDEVERSYIEMRDDYLELIEVHRTNQKSENMFGVGLGLLCGAVAAVSLPSIWADVPVFLGAAMMIRGFWLNIVAQRKLARRKPRG